MKEKLNNNRKVEFYVEMKENVTQKHNFTWKIVVNR